MPPTKRSFSFGRRPRRNRAALAAISAESLGRLGQRKRHHVDVRQSTRNKPVDHGQRQGRSTWPPCMSAIPSKVDCPNSRAVCVRHGPENRMAGHRRAKNAPQRSSCGSEIILCAHDGLDRLSISCNGLNGVVCTMFATSNRPISCSGGCSAGPLISTMRAHSI